ncbi:MULTISPECIES: FAD-binding protein [unclassified Microbulbifer]|uniref:electron transfer flavoprotein subunit alpha/FixB family protein n=1 Tax=unclassified Microbulbifer TaxID=2619833 RepID=UPI0027E53621|nr:MULTISPECIES: FAD-binding protein [unclassified Microbulbifer]
MKVLIIAQHSEGVLDATTLNVVRAALAVSEDISLLVAGSECRAVAEDARYLEGVTNVILADHPCYESLSAENLASLVAELAPSYSHILASANTFGKNVMPRLAALLDVQPLTDVLYIEDVDVFLRPIYAGNLIAKIQSHDKVKAMTVRTSAFPPVTQRTEACSLEVVDKVFDLQLSRRIKIEVGQSERPDLGTAKVVISGGRAIGSSENFKLLYSLAEKLDGAVGASRAAVDAGFVPYDLQVGQSGRVVAPELYIAVGISGAIQHIAGMKDSKVVVAINKDADAPIFDIADYGLVADLFDVLPELEAQLC